DRVRLTHHRMGSLNKHAASSPITASAAETSSWTTSLLAIPAVTCTTHRVLARAMPARAADMPRRVKTLPPHVTACSSPYTVYARRSGFDYVGRHRLQLFNMTEQRRRGALTGRCGRDALRVAGRCARMTDGALFLRGGCAPARTLHG